MSARNLSRFTRLWIWLAALSLFLMTGVASAVGRVEWKSKKLKENNESWRVDITIHMPKPPDVPTMPMKFEFEPAVYYERSMVDGDKLVERKVPLVGRQSLIEGVDVGFLDPGTGKIEKRTKFTFRLTRGHGYEAGEYDVTIRDGRNGNIIGQRTRIIFDGENEVIDRRAMVFTGEGKKKKKDSDTASGDTASKSDSAGETDSDAAEPSAEPASAAEEPPVDDMSAGEEPEPVETKQGGCGCRVTHSPLGSPALAFPALGLLVFAWRRRSRRCEIRSLS